MYLQMIYQMLESLQEQRGNEPKLNRLGTKEWEKTKQKVKSNLREEQNKNKCIYIIAYENYNYILEHILKNIKENKKDYNDKIQIFKGNIHFLI